MGLIDLVKTLANKKTAALGLATIALSCGIINSGCSIHRPVSPNSLNVNAETEANELLHSFPDEIPGAKKVEKYEIPGARYLLVHIRQQHLAEQITEEDRTSIIRVQNDIYSILNHLVDARVARKIYSEGHYPGLEEVITGFTKDLKYLLENSNETEREEVFILGAEYILFNEGKIELIASESLENQEAVIPYRGLGLAFYDDQLIEVVYENREDTLLSIVSQQDESLAVTVYGGVHTWGGSKSCGENFDSSNRISNRDNIAEWNAAHPDQKFSLIEITPESYSIEFDF